MKSHKKYDIKESFGGLKKYADEFLEYTKEIEEQEESISRTRVEFFINNLKSMLDQIEADAEKEES